MANCVNVTTANAFVDATSADYASLFKQSLDCSLDGTGDVQRKLTCLPGDTLRQTGMLKNEEFVTAGNVFDARDYVACLNCPLDNKKGVQRTLTPLPSGKLKLELGLRIRLFGASRSIKFVFELQPIAVDRVDVLESKLKDMKEELDKLSRRVDAGRRDDRYEESARWASRGGFIESFNAQGVSNRADRRRALDT
ncbi:hypothetical protein PF005_g15917 [Phytophthora fragariae]|uniref:Uncharacterized protein n=1 Tax=Phytophthora fragariae TaxID=53985 RepID=A0A6A3XIE0_9STRA|nr:hypothetical protein PF005_g15917 [Phytophthora fragariae]